MERFLSDFVFNLILGLQEEEVGIEIALETFFVYLKLFLDYSWIPS